MLVTSGSAGGEPGPSLQPADRAAGVAERRRA